MTRFFAISVDRATRQELNNVQAIIKEKADGWWHRHATFWIAGGLEASEWRDLLKPVLRSERSNVLVLLLPDEEDRRWGFYGPDAKRKSSWLHENYE